MTFLEKAMEIDGTKGKQRTRTEIIQGSCPSEYGLELIEKSDNCTVSKVADCQKCWNREMPNTELVKTVTLPMPPNTEPHFSNPVIEKAYNTGLNDAWECVRKINTLKYDVGIEIFGYEYASDILVELSPQEALAKLKAYEEVQKVFLLGEVVEIEGTYERAIVIVNKQDGRYKVLHDDFEIVTYTKDKLKKTGKHLDIQSVLNQKGGE